MTSILKQFYFAKMTLILKRMNNYLSHLRLKGRGGRSQLAWLQWKETSVILPPVYKQKTKKNTHFKKLVQVYLCHCKKVHLFNFIFESTLKSVERIILLKDKFGIVALNIIIIVDFFIIFKTMRNFFVAHIREFANI